VPQELATNRIPVQSNLTDVAYVRDAQWVELPARQFARVVSDTVAARTGRVVLSGAQAMGSPGARLSGELRTFGVDAGASAAVVTFDAALVRDEGGALEKQRFEVRVPVAAIEAAPVAVALNQAANQVAVQVADWVGR
jgi:cholesterol transport system auxiliary component